MSNLRSSKHRLPLSCVYTIMKYLLGPTKPTTGSHAARGSDTAALDVAKASAMKCLYVKLNTDPIWNVWWHLRVDAFTKESSPTTTWKTTVSFNSYWQHVNKHRLRHFRIKILRRLATTACGCYVDLLFFEKRNLHQNSANTRFPDNTFQDQTDRFAW